MVAHPSPPLHHQEAILAEVIVNFFVSLSKLDAFHFHRPVFQPIFLFYSI